MRLIVVAWLLSASSVWAARDDSYYPNGIQNPNLGDSHYWKEPYNVLQDLSKFDALYVTFHKCTWGQISNGNGNGNWGTGGEDNMWYLNSQPRWGPQAAVSLYGTLASDRNKAHACKKNNYITTFHTTAGIESLLQALYGVEELAAYTQQQNGDDHDNNNNNNQISSNCNGNGDNKRRRLEGGFQHYDMYEGALSYGVACVNDKFMRVTFNSANCGTLNIADVTDPLEAFNEAMGSYAKCVGIYKSGDNANNNNNDNDNQYSAQLSLLQYGRTCRFRSDDCPDPHGLLKRRQRGIERATNSLDSLNGIHEELHKKAYKFWFLAMCLLAGSMYLITCSRISRESSDDDVPQMYRDRMKIKDRGGTFKKMRGALKRRNRKKSRGGSSGTDDDSDDGPEDKFDDEFDDFFSHRKRHRKAGGSSKSPRGSSSSKDHRGRSRSRSKSRSKSRNRGGDRKNVDGGPSFDGDDGIPDPSSWANPDIANTFSSDQEVMLSPDFKLPENEPEPRGARITVTSSSGGDNETGSSFDYVNADHAAAGTRSNSNARSRSGSNARSRSGSNARSRSGSNARASSAARSRSGSIAGSRSGSNARSRGVSPANDTGSRASSPSKKWLPGWRKKRQPSKALL